MDTEVRSKPSRSRTRWWNKRRLWLVAAILLGLIAIGTAWVIVAYRREQARPLPTGILNQVDFNVFYWQKTPTWHIDKTTVKYDKTNQILTYVLLYGSAKITVTEQSAPEAFSDVPQAYTKLLNSLNNYASFDSYYAKVALTEPEEFNGQQSAVMSARGTMLFAHPTNGSLSDDNWKRLFNAINVERS